VGNICSSFDINYKSYKKEDILHMLYSLFWEGEGGLCHVVVFFTSKPTSEGQILAKESAIYLVQLGVGEINFIQKENFLKRGITSAWGKLLLGKG